jgi:primase-polymerase (primpol)-like protein
MDDTQIPAVLEAEAQWVCWRTEDRDGHPTKVPVTPGTGDYASVTAPATWCDYATARAYARDTEAVEGVGFVFTADDPYVGVDLDDCRDPATGEVDDWAVDILRRLASYTERSPSGTGFHVIVEGAVPAGGNRSGDCEMYDRNRYFTVTGDRVPGAPTGVVRRVDELQAIHTEYIATAEADAATGSPDDRPEVPVADEELLEQAMTAANGEKFRALWRGDTSGYPSHSEADQALCNLLAFWTGGDPQRIEDLVNQSGLVRDKWRDRADYRERTIRTAIEDCAAFYDPANDE